MNAKFSAAILAAAICFAGARAKAVNFLVNGDFETGNLTDWTTFTTVNGTSGSGLPDVAMFDTDNDGSQSLSARFNAGQAAFEGFASPRRGGGIFQQVNLSGGTYTLSVNAAVETGFDNADGGLVELMFDGVVLASHDFGAVSGGGTQHAFLVAAPSVSAGQHEVRLRITRAFLQGPSAPLQYIDNVILAPEPSTLSLVVLSGLAVAGRRKR